MTKTIDLIDRLASLELSLIGYMAAVERQIAKAIEGDRQQLDVFIEYLKPELREMRRDISWLKAKWEKFSI
jgi:hypothetical protein